MFRIKNNIIFCAIFIFNIHSIHANPLVESEWLKDKVCVEGYKY